MKKRTHERAEDKRTITISIEKEDVEEIDILAKQENRTRSNWIVTELKKAVAEKMGRKKISALPSVADAENPFTRSTVISQQGINRSSKQSSPSPRKR